MKRDAKTLMFLGTGSDVGKSIAATAFCRILKRRGYRVAPFKAQNMSNNSYVTVEGGEIGRAQVAQAEAAGLLPSVHMNPVLLKPSSGQAAQVVVQGRVATQLTAMEYHGYKETLRQVVMDSYDRLSSQYDVIVLEGAGSCCEMNLKENDLVNFRMAKSAGAACVLVADIDKGGVFAQVIGTYDLMDKDEQDLTIGFLINKFRGDPRLFHSGIRILEEKTGKSVLGLVPFFEDILVDTEDSVAVQQDKRALRAVGKETVNVAVLRLPAISNFTDLEILEREPDVVVNYITRSGELSSEYDLLVIPGTKNVMEDAAWLSRRGWKKRIADFAAQGRTTLGICGGYQLLGKEIEDPHGVESGRGEVRGLGLLPVETRLDKDKVVRRVNGECPLYGCKLKGYEIHMGRSTPVGSTGRPFALLKEPGKGRKWEDGWVSEDGRVIGTYVHGVLDSPEIRGHLLNRLRRAKGLRPRKPRQGRLARFREYDRLADHFERHCDVEKIIEKAIRKGQLRS
ncbi:MAG: cobyric acid synthase [Deltaproteobacteria bacterium]|nr:cobyric acid synthase [Deltaproteobacteria bacterium]MBW2137396.1 cobyric acid synthase [Deltaproteobacteria bacterium]